MIKYRKILSFSLGVIILSITTNAYATGNWIEFNNNTGVDLYWSNTGDIDDCASSDKKLSKDSSGTIRVDDSDHRAFDLAGVTTALHICQNAKDSSGNTVVDNYILLNLYYKQTNSIKFSCDWDQDLEGLILINGNIELKLTTINPNGGGLTRQGCIYTGELIQGTLMSNGEEIHIRN